MLDTYFLPAIYWAFITGAFGGAFFAYILKGHETDEDCSICYETMSGRKNDTLPCGHTFHNLCLVKTFIHGNFVDRNVKFTCPLCRQKCKVFVNIDFA